MNIHKKRYKNFCSNRDLCLILPSFKWFTRATYQYGFSYTLSLVRTLPAAVAIDSMPPLFSNILPTYTRVRLSSMTELVATSVINFWPAEKGSIVNGRYGCYVNFQLSYYSSTILFISSLGGLWVGFEFYGVNLFVYCLATSLKPIVIPLKLQAS